MKILAIETSCDETSAAIVENGRNILSNVVASSKDLHTKTGGIIPEIAAREQVKCMIPVMNETMKQCNNATMKEIDALAVTVGPGLIGSLLVGVETAKTISFVTGKPLIPVNHVLAHIYANWLNVKNEPEFPALALVISGGHTELFILMSHQDMHWIGGTLDDASGECFDKSARLLGLGYPGGPAISKAADEYRIMNHESRIKEKIKLPRPLIGSKDFNFSFSGLKTAVLREVNKLKAIQQSASASPEPTRDGYNNIAIKQLANEIQESITDVLIKKTLKAAEKYNVKSVIIGGGVAANQRLTEKFKLSIINSQLSIKLFIPPVSLCTDNAAYIASFAYFHNKPVDWKDINARPDLEVEI